MQTMIDQEVASLMKIAAGWHRPILPTQTITQRSLFSCYLSTVSGYWQILERPFEVLCRPSGGVLADKKGIGSLLHQYPPKRHFAIYLSQVSAHRFLWNFMAIRTGSAASS